MSPWLVLPRFAAAVLLAVTLIVCTGPFCRNAARARAYVATATADPGRPAGLPASTQAGVQPHCASTCVGVPAVAPWQPVAEGQVGTADSPPPARLHPGHAGGPAPPPPRA